MFLVKGQTSIAIGFENLANGVDIGSGPKVQSWNVNKRICKQTADKIISFLHSKVLADIAVCTLQC